MLPFFAGAPRSTGRGRGTLCRRGSLAKGTMSKTGIGKKPNLCSSLYDEVLGYEN